MEREGLLKSIAIVGYNVGFGAKKHFATYDIVVKAPGWIGFVSSAVGILALIYDPLSAKLPSAILVILGICSLYVSAYRAEDYDAAGRTLTQLFNELRDLYIGVESGSDAVAGHSKYKELEAKLYQSGLSKQVLFSDWYAHYKFFSQQQIGWIEQELHFHWTDKIPLGARIAIVIVGTALLALGLYLWHRY